MCCSIFMFLIPTLIYYRHDRHIRYIFFLKILCFILFLKDYSQIDIYLSLSLDIFLNFFHILEKQLAIYGRIDSNMQHFYVWHWKHWKRWFVVLTLALVTATTLWFQYNGTLSVFSTDKPSAFSKGNKKSNNIAITFNISWGEKKIHDILKVLKKHQVQATFFVSGEWAERHPDILEDITDDKHELGMLGYRYKSYLDQDIDAVRKDLTYAKEI